MSTAKALFQNQPALDASLQVDLSLKFVRLLEITPKGLVSFEFSMGWPDLLVELLLPQAAFFEFCLVQKITDIRFENDEVRQEWSAISQ